MVDVDSCSLFVVRCSEKKLMVDGCSLFVVRRKSWWLMVHG